jgi:anthranilate synthase/aminodeoxychorismate synthase-like glutamine amidotransferase
VILVIDNYDSFTWNLVQQFERLSGLSVEVVRNDAFEPRSVLSMGAEAIVVSPGPGEPSRAGRIVELIRLNESLPLLGVCLGHQAVGEAFGATVGRAPLPVHGKAEEVRHNGLRLFTGVPLPMRAVRYHSLVVDSSSLPPELEVDATTGEGLIMALSHRSRPIFGVQFHPESYGTEDGDLVISNFLRLAGVSRFSAVSADPAATKGATS